MSTQQPKKYNILLVGDSCTDVYQFGSVDRLSPEAPVPVFTPTRNYSRPGMVLNVAANFKSLGCAVSVLTGSPSIKTRLIDERSRQQLLRMDQDQLNEPISLTSELPPVYNAVVISDYNKGTVTYELIKDIIGMAQVPVFIDTKKTDLAQMRGAWVKINELEHSRLISDCPQLIVTRGSRGAEIMHQGVKFDAPTVEVADVTGAGDTFLAALTYQFLQTQNIVLAVEFAIRAASVTVQHLGVYAPSLEEIQ